MDFIDLPSTFRDKSVQLAISRISRIVKCQSFVINIVNLIGALYLISIKMSLILISKLVPLTPEIVRTHCRLTDLLDNSKGYRFPARINFQKCRKNCCIS